MNLKKIQIRQLTDELEYHFKASRDQGNIIAEYLSADPLLSIARRARHLP